jgi:hypothetical protein
MALITCPQLQGDLDANFGAANQPTIATEPAALASFLLSPTNTANVLQNQIDSKSGKYRAVELVYSNQYLESEISTVAAKACTSSNERGQLSTTYEINPALGVSVNEKFDIGNMAAMCMDNSLWFAQRIQAMMDGMVRKMSTVVATDVVALAGKFATGDLDQDGSAIVNDQKIISTRKTGGDLDYRGFEEVLFSAMNAGYGSIPYIFGFGEAYKYFQKLNFGCCTGDGIELGAMAGQNTWAFGADKKVATAMGSGNEFLTLAAGAAQIITWNEFLGQFNTVNDESYKQGVISDPKTGLPFDIQIKNDCGTVYVNMKLAFKTVGLPADMFAVGDAFRGVNYINKFEIVNP